MKKFFLTILSACFLLCLQNNVYSDNTANTSIVDENIITKNDSGNIYPVFETPEYKPAFFKMILILIALIALIFLTFWIFRRLMRIRVTQGNLTKSIKILEKRAISPKSILYVVEIDGRRVLISESNLEVRKIKDLD